MTRRVLQAALAAVVATGLGGGGVSAGTTGGVYDMRAMLGQPHPFAGRSKPAMASPAATPAPAGAKPAAPAAAPERRAQAQPSEPVSAVPSKSKKSKGLYGISEVRVGAFYADFGPFSHQKEDGVNANFEVLFNSPDFLDVIWSPRPHIGTTWNTSSNTNTPFYAGLSWEWDFWDDFMWGFSLGGAYHDGYTDKDTAPTDRKELGCSILFRESLKMGYRINEHHSIMAHLDHISNAKLCDTNEGLESLGIQYGYRF